MKINLIELLNSSSKLNPLYLSYINGTNYFSDFKKKFDDLISHKKLNEKDAEDILKNKLQLSKKKFDEEQYYEGATELTILFHMLNLKHTKFYYEPRLNGTKKNPECSVVLENGFRINVEAKCPSHKQFIANSVLSSSNKKESNDVVLRFRSAGRAPDYNGYMDFTKRMQVELDDSNPENISIEMVKNNDNKLKDYLISANAKFNSPLNKDEANLLFIALDKTSEISEWMGYLYLARGLFTSYTFYDPRMYMNVDCIILTNSYFRHLNNDRIDGSSWELNEGFNIFAINPFVSSFDVKRIGKLKGIINNNIMNYTSQLLNHKVEGLPDDFQLPILVPSFNIEALRKNDKFLFYGKSEHDKDSELLE